MGEVLLPTKESHTQWTSTVHSNLNWRYQAIALTENQPDLRSRVETRYGDCSPTTPM